MTKLFHKNDIKLGIGLGLLLPMMVYFTLQGIYVLLAQSGNLQTNISPEFRERTIAILSIAADIIPMRYYQKKRFCTETMRGVTIAVGVLVILWMIYFLPGMF